VALIELFPRLTPAATLSEKSPSDALESSRFTITNSGYFKVTDVSASCFLWNVRLGRISIASSLAQTVSPPEKTLEPNDSMTVPCVTKQTSGPWSTPLSQADIGIVAYYTPWPFTIWRRHRLFRFVARFDNSGDVIGWDPQPSSEMEPDFEKFTEYRKAHGY